jgi:hypothetical protein
MQQGRLAAPSLFSLFPLNGRRRLARHVVGDAGDAFDFIDDAAGNGFQQFVRQVSSTRGHEVDGFHGTQGNDPGVTTAIADNANRFNSLEHYKHLADFVGTSPTLKAHLANNAATRLAVDKRLIAHQPRIFLVKQLVTVGMRSNLTNRDYLP